MGSKSLTPSELRDLSAHVAALLAAEVATSTLRAEPQDEANAPTCTSPGLNGRNSHPTNDAPNWWERDQDDPSDPFYAVLYELAVRFELAPVQQMQVLSKAAYEFYTGPACKALLEPVHEQLQQAQGHNESTLRAIVDDLLWVAWRVVPLGAAVIGRAAPGAAAFPPRDSRAHHRR